MNGNENCDDRGPRIGSAGVPRCRRPKGHDGEHRPAAGDGWGDVRWSNLTRPVTAPLPPDPADVTEEDRVKVQSAMGWGGLDDHYLTGAEIAQRDAIAAALAAERAAVARRVLALAEELDAQAADAEHLAEEHRRARNLTQAGVFAGKKVAKRDAAARLRATVAAALGETGGRQ